MSVIAVKGVPQKWSLINVVKILAKAINGNFEALNFQTGVKARAMKICYLRLSEKLDPVRVVEKINSTTFPKQFRPFAFIPDHVPDIPLAAKPKRMPLKMRRALKVQEENAPEKVLTLTNDEILAELQSKYPGLYNVSLKTNHKLLEDLAKKIFDRLKVIRERNAEVTDSCFMLSQWYRRMHPHFGDFQLVLSTLHAIEDAAGTPRTQLQEKELAALPPNPYMIDNLPFNKVQSACNKYSDRIIKKLDYNARVPLLAIVGEVSGHRPLSCVHVVRPARPRSRPTPDTKTADGVRTVSDHVKNLKSEVTDTDTEDEIVRKKVREELKKMTPFLPLIVRQVVTKHFIPRKTQNYKVRIYGEPFLPGKETMTPFVRRYQPVRIMRSDRMFNCLRFNVPPSHYASLMAMDGTVLNGAKLVIRSSDLPQYKVSAATLALAGSGGVEQQADEGVDEEATEDWNDVM